MNNAIKILIVEDEVLIAEYIKDILENKGYTNLRIAHTVAETYLKINDFLPNIILLDINLEGNNEGIAIAKTVGEEIPIIFLTAQNDIETITNALQTKPETYLTKPIKVPDLLASINLWQIKHQSKSIVVKVDYKDEIIDIDTIIYITSEKNYIDIFTQTQKFITRKSLSQLLEELPANFVQIHRSVVINKNYIQKKSVTKVFINDTELPISRNYYFDL